MTGSYFGFAASAFGGVGAGFRDELSVHSP